MFKKVGGKAAARSATRRIMSVTFADERELVSAQCLEARRKLSHPPTPSCESSSFPICTLSL
jgi:hypothetical protein